MHRRICPVCGLILTTAVATCPCCKQTLPPRGKPALNLEQEQITLYNYMLPALEDQKHLRGCQTQILNRMREYIRPLGSANYEVLKSIIDEEFADIFSRIKAVQDHNSRVITQAYTKFNSTMQNSEYQGLGFSVITDGAGAVAYALVDALEHYAHDVTVTQTAYKNLLSDMQNLSASSSGSIYADQILRAIDRIIWLMGLMLDIKAFDEENPDFYKKNIGYTNFHDVYLKDVFAPEAMKTSFWKMKPLDSQALCSAMEVAGFIAICSSFYGTTGNTKFISTGKFEAGFIRRNYGKEHPKELAAYNKHLIQLADEALARKEYYTAATLYSQVDNDPAAMRKSIAIWNEHLQHMQPLAAGYMLGANGDALNLLLSRISAALPSFDPFRQIASGIDLNAVALTFGGHIQVVDKKAYRGKGQASEDCTAWEEVTAIDCSEKHLVALFADGTVRAVGENGYGQCNVKQWCHVTQIKAVGESTAAVTGSGTVFLAGRAAKCATTWQEWKNVKQIYLLENKTQSGIVVLDTDGRVFADGEVAFDKTALEKWHHVVRICWFQDGIFGITESGDVLYEGASEQLKVFCSHLKGIVKIVYYADSYIQKFAAIKADGAVITAGIPFDVSDWQNVVELECHTRPYQSGLNLCAVTAYGNILTAGADYMKNTESWKPFEHVDSICRIQKQTLEELIQKAQQELAETKGLFSGSKRKKLEKSIAFMQTQYPWDA